MKINMPMSFCKPVSGNEKKNEVKVEILGNT